VNNNNSASPRQRTEQPGGDARPAVIGSTNNSQVQVVAATNAQPLGRRTRRRSRAVIRAQDRPDSRRRDVPRASPDGKPPAARGLERLALRPDRREDADRRLNGAIDKSALPSDSRCTGGSVATNVATRSVEQSRQPEPVALAPVHHRLAVHHLPVGARTILTCSRRSRPAIVGASSWARVGRPQISSITQCCSSCYPRAGTTTGCSWSPCARGDPARRTPHEAVAVSVLRVGESITASAATVIVALLTSRWPASASTTTWACPSRRHLRMLLAGSLAAGPPRHLRRAVFWPSKAIHSE